MQLSDMPFVLRRSRKAFLRVLPPRRHIVAIMTGGLKRLYCRIRENEEISHNGMFSCTLFLAVVAHDR